MKTRYLFLLPSLLLVLGGCAVQTGIDINPSPVVLPGSYSTQGTRDIDRQWWTEFNDPALQQLVETAFADNFSLAAAKERLIQAQIIAQKAGADRQPSVDGRAKVGETWSHSDGSTSSTGNLLIGIATSYEIDLWGRLQATEDAALLDAEAREEDLQTAALSLAAQIANTWYNLGAAESQLELLVEQQEVNKMGLELIKLRFTAGQVGIADMLQQEQLIESKNGELAQQRATCKVLENQLAILTGVSPGLSTLSETPELLKLPPLPDAGLPSALLQNRPDIRSDYLALLAADKRVAAAIANKYPKLNLSTDLYTSGSSTGDLFSDWVASLLANLTGPIFDGGQRELEVERLSSVAKERLSDYSQTILTAVGEVEDALVQEEEQDKYITSLEAQLDLAHKTVVNVRDRYKQGVENYQRVLTALLSYQNLERNLINARRDRIGYRIDLYKALGGSVIFNEENKQ